MVCYCILNCINRSVIDICSCDEHEAPPASLILFSAVLVKSFAFTITGIFGRVPFPRTLKYPDLVTSITGALSALPAAAFLVFSKTSDHNLSVLIVGQYFQFLWRWNTLIPHLP